MTKTNKSLDIIPVYGEKYTILCVIDRKNHPRMYLIPVTDVHTYNLKAFMPYDMLPEDIIKNIKNHTYREFNGVNGAIPLKATVR